MLTRRLFLTGGATLLAAPAIVRFESLMPVRALVDRYIDADKVRFVAGPPQKIGGFMHSEDFTTILRAALQNTRLSMQCWGKALE